MSKIYTKTGDDGTTGIIGGARVAKNDPRIEAIGAVDELNAAIGILYETADAPSKGATKNLLLIIQSDLFTLGSELADPELKYITVTLDEKSVTLLEQAIDVRDAQLTPLKNFILPSGTLWAAQTHLARAVCRRAERRIVELAHLTPLRPLLTHYLNRLSDLLFVLAREHIAQNNKAEVIWKP